MTELRAENLTVNADDTTLLSDASFRLKPGELVALLGPNGAGKTTLLRAALGLLKPDAGHAMIGAHNVETLAPLERARKLAYLPQSRPLAWPNMVSDVVALGRYAYGAEVGQLGESDQAAVDRALEACDITHLAARKADTLSGGELARMHCARALAAETPLLIADEPVAALDPRHQFRVLDVIRRFVDDGGGALVVLHDVALAARYADRLIWMKSGRIVADGAPEETLSAARLADVYDIDAQVEGRRVELLGARLQS